MKKLRMVFVFMVLCMSFLGFQYLEQVRKNRGFAKGSRVPGFQQIDNMRWAGVWEDEIKNSFPYTIAATSDGGFVLGAMTWAYGAGYTDLWLIKISSRFEVEWQKTYGGSYYDAWYQIRIKENPDRSLMVFSDTASFGRPTIPGFLS